MSDVLVARNEPEGRLRSLASMYGAVIRTQFLATMQYRVANVVEMTLMLAEPLVYLMVWQIVAREQGGEVAGYTTGRFAAYYVVWSLVRVFTQVGSPRNWEFWVQQGRMSTFLMRPIHPVHHDVATWIGFAISRSLMWVPSGLVLTLVFRPVLTTSPAQIVVFFVAGGLANVMRTLVNAIAGTTAFWLTRVGGVSAIVSVVDLLTSGRIVPPELMPGWAQAVTWALPFRWGFFFPIQALIGPISGAALAVGLAMQVVWMAVIVMVLRAMWRRGVVRYGAVGG